MAELGFVGQLLSAREGVNAPEYGGAPYTVLEFSPVEGDVFSLRADGHLADTLKASFRKDLPWRLGVSPRMQSGKFTMKIVSVSVGKAKE